MSKSDEREDAIKEYDHLTRAMKIKVDQLKQFEEEELVRIIREFDFKSYGRRYHIDPPTVFSTMFGGASADREIIKNGMQKRNFME